ncbi:MAG: hypothetical protein LBD78_11950 [Spirochaetaceae bacterium]|jgi:ribonucleoside-triphosphate reductase|nr:hypothetical protein [Spirochaetaceae bacterium]
MRNLEDIEKDLTLVREAIAGVKGRPAEVYSRIVGYYRSVRNWNKGKREEYDERKLYRVSGILPPEIPALKPGAKTGDTVEREAVAGPVSGSSPEKPAECLPEQRLLLFVRPACPACPGAKAAAGRLGIPVDLVNADTEAGLAEALHRQVLSTPTAILLNGEGEELDRALDSGGITALGARLVV